jgi:hypothetical protein
MGDQNATGNINEARRVSARLREAIDEAGADRVENGSEDDRQRGGGGKWRLILGSSSGISALSVAHAVGRAVGEKILREK